ncbi:hypothetical protein SEVIR_4G281100v4 [Setaria viridis]|nr:uncharacterized protein LOC101776484 [Setaria italica]XP_034589707.1 uncharacterized protein LOC117851902 [Setaria viridis]RCV23056.1 hypothetical protein SETIT_4G268600v2 [Setaria italica]TKW23257.1 hypothetical protein SEVIR_4G281100v2 [Setaria viridis]
MAEAGSAAASSARGPSASSSGCRGGRGCGLALGRLVRKLRRQSRMLVCTATAAGARHGHAASSSSSARCLQYDALSYARNFDFGTALDGSDGGYSFASRFVLAAPARRPQ